jgi:hypothetical protein
MRFPTAVVESKDGTISVASAFAGYQEGESIAAVIIIISLIPLSLHSFTCWQKFNIAIDQ